MIDEQPEQFMNKDTKRCPTCKRLFTRQELYLSANQWFRRIYCGRKCSSKGRYSIRYGKR